MIIKSTLTNEPGVAQVRIEFWFNEGEHESGADLITLNLFRWPKSPTNYDTGIQLGNFARHHFCERKDAECQYSPTGYCSPHDATPGSLAEWAGEFRKLRIRWKFDEHTIAMRLLNICCIYPFRMTGYAEMKENIEELKCARLIPYTH